MALTAQRLQKTCEYLGSVELNLKSLINGHTYKMEARERRRRGRREGGGE